MAEQKTLLETVMEYARIDTADTSAAQELLDSAESLIIGGIECKAKDALEALPLFRLACKMLVAFWYDNRTPEPEASSNPPLPFGFTGIMTQLRNWQPPAPPA